MWFLPIKSPVWSERLNNLYSPPPAANPHARPHAEYMQDYAAHCKVCPVAAALRTPTENEGAGSFYEDSRLEILLRWGDMR